MMPTVREKKIEGDSRGLESKKTFTECKLTPKMIALEDESQCNLRRSSFKTEYWI
jgi:hypothetical protein